MLPTSESTRYSCTSSPKRARTNAPIESASVDVRGSSGSSAARALPRHDSSLVVASGRSRPGTPRRSPSGIGCRPSRQTAAPTGSGETRSSPSPTRSARAVASGTRARNASAPSSTPATPANRLVAILPPSRSVDSYTTTALSASASRRASAAASPLMPAPTTAMRRLTVSSRAQRRPDRRVPP